MRVQLIGLGHVGRSLVQLIDEKKATLKLMGIELDLVSVTDSTGTAVDGNGLDPVDVVRLKQNSWKDFPGYSEGYSSLKAIREVDCDITVEVTPSTFDGEPGLSNIRAALQARKNVVTANKGPLVVAYGELMKMARENGLNLFYEATVAAHLPVFCLANSCFMADQLESVKGILNATTNYVLGEMEKGNSFQGAVDESVRAGWAETNYSDDVDGIDSARKLVIIANALFGQNARLVDVEVVGIRNVQELIAASRVENGRVKLLCSIEQGEAGLEMKVKPAVVSFNDALATVNGGDMAMEFCFGTSRKIFVSAEFLGPKQTAYAVLNDILKVAKKGAC
jgi:homoserine dehydrogenase